MVIFSRFLLRVLQADLSIFCSRSPLQENNDFIHFCKDYQLFLNVTEK